MPPRTQSRLAHPRHAVTAVVVAHDGGRWLPETLAAIAAQRRPVQRTLGVDTGSKDRSRTALVSALGKAAVLQASADTGFGAAVALALEAAADAPGGDATTEWVWLLHDDSAPDPDALHELLAVAVDSPSAAVLGCKAVGWDDPRRLLETGFTTGPGGHRETGLDPFEVDQGQHDAVRDVLAVGTAGMLVRRDVWEALGGLDPRLPLWRDDLDLCWRARSAGHRVLVVPSARVRHAEAATRGLRHLDAGGVRPWRADRAHILYVLLAHARGALLPLVAARLVLGSLLRAAGLLLGKRFADSYDELAALLSVLGQPRRIAEARRARRALRTEPHSAIRPLLAGRMVRVRHLLEAGGRRVSRWSAQLGVEPVEAAPRAIETGPSEYDDDLDLGGGGLLRRLLLQPPVVMVAALAALALLSSRELVGGGALVGGALLGAPAGAADLWQAYTASWHDVGAGTDATVGPLVAVLALLATVLLGKAGAAVGLLVFLAVPLAALSCYLCGRAVVPPRWLRAALASTYALLPPLTGALASGRLGAVIAHVLLPPLALASWRVLAGTGSGWRGIAGVGLLAATVVAAAPLLYPLLVLGWVALAVGAALRQQEAPRGALPALRPAALVVLPLVLLLPWSLQMLTHPASVLLHPGLAVPGLVEPDIATWRLLLGWPGGPGLPWVWLALPLLALALVGLLRRSGATLARSAWAVALTALVCAIVVSRLEVRSASGAPVGGWPGPLLSALGLALVVAAGVAARGARAALGRLSFSWRQPAAALLALAAVVGLLGMAATWLRADSLVSRVDADLRPAFVAADAQAGRQPRTLVLRAGGDAVGYDLLRGEPLGLAEADLAGTGPGRARLDAVVRDLVSGRGNAAAERLATYGARYVAVRAPADGSLVHALDGTAGLSRIAVESETALWQVVIPAGGLVVLDAPATEAARSGGTPPPGLLTDHPPVVLQAQGQVPELTAALPAGSGDRMVVLAQARDAGWRAELDGRPLPAATAWGWAQGFVLPSEPGRLRVWHSDRGHRRALVLQGVLAAAVLLVAAPSARRRSLIPAPADIADDADREDP